MFLPYLTAFVLVFSGMAIGYFLWHHESSQDDALRDEMLRQNEQLKKTLTTAQTSYTALDDRFSRQRGQLNVLQKLCDDWSASREHADRERAELEVQLNDRTRRCDELVTEVGDLKKKSLKLEDSLHTTTQTQLLKLADIEGGWQKKFSKTQSLMLQHQSDVKSLSTDKETTLQKLHAAESKIAELEAELKSNQTTLETAKGNVQGLEKEHVSLETALKHTNDLLKKSEGQTAAERSEKDSLKESLASSQTQCDRLQGQIETLQDELVEKETFKQKSESLILSLSNANGQLEKVLAQRDNALTSYSSAQTIAKGLQTRIDNQEQTIHRLRKCQDDALENLKHELKNRSEIESKFDVRLKELRDQSNQENAKKADLVSELRQQLTASKSQIGDQKSQIDDQKTQIVDQKTQIADQKTQIDDHKSQIADQKTQTADLKTQTENLKTQIKDLKKQNETIVKTQKQDFDAEVEMLHEAAESELLELKQQLTTANQTFDQTKQKHADQLNALQSSLRQRETEVQALAAVEQKLSEKETQLSQLATKIDVESVDYSKTIVKLNTQREQLHADLEIARDQMKAQLKQDSETIGLLQGERNELRTEVEDLNAKIGELQGSMVNLEKTSQQYAADAALLETSQQRMRELEKTLEKKDDALKQLQAESNELSRLRDEHAATLRRQAELQSRLDSMMTDHLSSRNREQSHQQEIDRIRQQLDQSETTISQLQTERTELLSEMAAQQDAQRKLDQRREQAAQLESARREREAQLESQRRDELENAAVISFTQAMQQRNEANFNSEYGGVVRMDSTRGIVFTEAPESKDDLKLISGIATVLEKRLNEFGIYTFKQIMDWQPAEIEEFSRLLTFKERIERDDWQGQARFFYNKKLKESRQVA